MPQRTTGSSRSSGEAPLAPPDLSRAASTQATTAGTRRFATRFSGFPAEYWQDFPRKLTASALGLGTYLGDCTDEDDALYRESIHLALTAGINVIDTASNYRCQRSERAVGQAVEEAVACGDVRRDEILICTKGGYIALDGEPPASREAYDRWITETLVEPGVVARADLVRGGHSLSPSFLRHQLAQSLGNLRLRSIDLYYLHNPEEQLLGVDRETFLQRMRTAFELLEERAMAGVITGYGCATWAGFRVGQDHRQYLSLADLVGVAREIAGAAHHFRAIQLPVNLAMPEAARTPTQQLGKKLVTVLEAADALGLGVVASASLMQGKLTQGLPRELHELFPDCETDAQRALRFVTSLPGVATALTGARQAAHVRENIASWSARATD